MKHIDTAFEPKFLVAFTLPEWQLLLKASENHYDGVCRDLSKSGGLIKRNHDACIGSEDWINWFSFRDLDTICKVAEMACYSDRQLGTHILFGITEIFHRSNQLYLEFRKVIEAHDEAGNKENTEASNG